MDIELLSKSYKTRRLNSSDIEVVYDMMRKNDIYYQYHPPVVTRESIAEDMRSLPPGKHYPDKYYLGFFKDDDLVAIMDLVLSYPVRVSAFIGLFMTDVRFQHRGVGSGLIDEICVYLKQIGYARIRLGVDRGNPQSFSFWSKNNFSVIDEKEYIVMERAL